MSRYARPKWDAFSFTINDEHGTNNECTVHMNISINQIKTGFIVYNFQYLVAT
jgi:hypothetical protein